MSDFLRKWNDKQNTIIVFAGVFDPVHKGHISAAKEALKDIGGMVVFIPERVPQHKHGTTAYEHRLNMLRIATANDAQLQVVDYPNDHQKIKETFTWLNDTYPGRSFIWLVGSDVLPLIHTWPDSDKLRSFNVRHVLAMKRGDETAVDTIFETPAYRKRRKRSRHEHLSSSYVREDMASRHTALPDGVYEYIKEHNLYSDTLK